MDSYFNIVRKLNKRNSKLYFLKKDALSTVVISKISYLVTPLFIFFKLSPNIITLINFLVSLLSIILIIQLNAQLFAWGIFLYFLYRVLDYCDGSVARYFKTSSFYGRLIDAFSDIFFLAFLILAVSFYNFKTFQNENLLILGVIASIFAIFDTFIYDKYSSLARWSNEENKTKIIPYLRKKIYPRITETCLDIYSLCFFILPFLVNNKFYFEKVILLLFVTIIAQSVQNLIFHFVVAYKSFGVSAKDKNYYTKK